MCTSVCVHIYTHKCTHTQTHAYIISHILVNVRGMAEIVNHLEANTTIIIIASKNHQ